MSKINENAHENSAYFRGRPPEQVEQIKIHVDKLKGEKDTAGRGVSIYSSEYSKVFEDGVYKNDTSIRIIQTLSLKRIVETTSRPSQSKEPTSSK
jgi:hypothetical protein